MGDRKKTKDQLITEIVKLRGQLHAKEENIQNPDKLIQDRFISIIKNQVYNVFKIGLKEFPGKLSIKAVYSNISDKNIFKLNPNSETTILEKNGIPLSIFTLIQKLIKTEKPVHEIINICNENSEGIWCDLFLIKENDEQIFLFYRDLTEINNLFLGLEKTKRDLRELQDNVPIGLYKSTPDGKLLYINNWFAKMLGYDSPKDLIRKDVRELYADQTDRLNIVKHLNNEGKQDKIEVQLKCKDNSLIWVVINANTVFDSDHKAISYDGYIYDITERKLALDKLKDSESIFNSIADNIQSLIYIFNTSGQFIYVSPAVYEVTGYKSHELLKKKFFEIIHPDDVDIVKKRGTDRLAGKMAPRNYEFKILTKQGNPKWIEIFTTTTDLKGESVAVGIATDITARKEALEEIKSNEEKYKTLYSFFRLMADNVPDMIWAKNLAKEYIFVNRSVCKTLFNVADTEEPVGKTDEYYIQKEQGIHADDPTWFTFGENSPDSDEQVIETQKTQRVDEYGYVRGKFMHMDIQKSPLWDNEGNMIGIVGSGRDVTLQRKMEENQHREELIKTIIYGISNAVNTTKDLGEFFTVTRLELSRIIDTTNLFIALYDEEKDMISMPYFVDEKDRFTNLPRRKTLTHYLIKNKKPLLLKSNDYLELARRNEIELVGSPAKVWLGVPLQLKNELIGAIVLQNYKDENAFNKNDLDLMKFISVQISASISQKMADDSLRESEFMLRQIIDNVPVMIFAKDINLKYVLVNKEFASAYGLRVDEIEGRLQSDIHPIKSEIETYLEDDLSVIEQGEIKVINEEKFTTRDEDIRILKTIKIPFKATTRQGIALLGVAMDITDRRKAEVELNKAKEKAEESDRLKTAFLANMSHEIRTPMNAIVGFSELLHDPELTDKNRKEFVKLIGDNSKLLLNLIEDIIDVAKIEAEQLKIVHTTCQVNLILDELHHHYSNQVRRFVDKNIELTITKQFRENDFSIKTDPLRFKQIMNNLLGNAIKFTQQGIVEFGYKVENERIIFHIRDTGIGLAQDKLGLIFERFRQAQESSTKEYGGTGLGLTISRRLVELLGGSIWVESVLNEGSTFFFSLPYIPVKSHTVAQISNYSLDSHNWRGKTILVAEDEKSNFELIKATLQKTNVEILWAKNGLEAVEFAFTSPGISLVLMDMRMPEMNGYEATLKIKEIRNNLPIISLTAYAMTEDRDKSFLAGCDEYISKPFNPIDLIRKMAKYIKI